MNRLGQDRARSLLKDMASWDFDRQEVAAYDLAQLLEQPHEFPADLVHDILDGFRSHLGSESIEVQSNVLKCNGRLLMAVSEQHRKYYLSAMFDQLASSKDTKDKDLFAICFKTMINDVPESRSEPLSHLLELVVPELIRRKDALFFELAEILFATARKWPACAFWSVVDRSEVVLRLVEHLS